jgi:hypothetical protein
MKKALIVVWIFIVSSAGLLFAYDQELIGAYEYAYANSITTQTPIENAYMYGPLTRVAMAKMMANYAIEVMGKTPTTTMTCTFPDVSNGLDVQYDNGVTKACQLGLMGVGINNFNPMGLVTRAEFGTVLSRALYGNTYNVTTTPYYAAHLQALKNAGIMTKIDMPAQLEVRGYVMLMMQRADDFVGGWTWGDLTAPTANVIYSTTGSTTGSVTATLTWRSEAITGVNTYSHLFTGNGTFIFYFQDLNWNAGSVTATVANIADTTKPTAMVTYSTTWATNGDVVATLTWRSETLTGINASTHTFTGNWTFTFTFSDLAGNTGSVTATVANIDKTAPTATVSLSPLSGEYISWNITATLSWYSETLTITNNSWLNTYIFTGNGSFIFNFVDAAGNTGNTTTTVSYWTGS